MPTASAKVVPLDGGNWESEVVSSPVPVVVDFWAEWCAPCRMMRPTIEALAEELGERAKVGTLNIDDHPELAQQHGILGVPTIMIFEGGELKEQVIGVTDQEYLSELVAKHLS